MEKALQGSDFLKKHLPCAAREIDTKVFSHVEITKMKLIVNNADVRLKGDFVCLTDIAKVSNRKPSETIRSWLRNQNTLNYLEVWERESNPNFKGGDFATFKMEATKNSQPVSVPKYIKSANSVGIFTEAGKYGGTYAHIEIAFEFATWLSPEFKYYFFKEWIAMKLNTGDQTVQFALHKAKSNLQEAADWLELVEQKNIKKRLKEE